MKTFFNAFIAQMRVVAHDQGIILFVIFLPLVYPILYSLIYNPELVRDVKTVVVDHDMTSRSRELTRRMNATQGVNVIGYAADINEARHAVNSHKAYAILEIPEGFQRNTTNGEGSEMVLYCEMSLMLRYRSLLMAATDVAMDMGADIRNETIDLTLPLAETVVTGEGYGINAVSMGDITSGFDSFVMPGVIILILHQCIILAVGMAGGARHEYPVELGFNPLARRPHALQKMLGEMLCFFVIAMVAIVWLLYYVPLIFRFPQEGLIWEEIVFIFPMVIACICLGFMLQSVIFQREGVFIVWVATSIVFLFLSGLTWPRFAMSPFWQGVGDIIPATWGVEGFIRMNANGASLAQAGTEYRNLWILAGVYFVMAYALQRWVVRPSVRRRYLLDAGRHQDTPGASAAAD